MNEPPEHRHLTRHAVDTDPAETAEWREALQSLADNHGAGGQQQGDAE